jgi:SAM-dependent methyltransferase
LHVLDTSSNLPDKADTGVLLQALIGHFSAEKMPIGGAEPKLIADLRRELEGNDLLSQDMLHFWRMLERCVGRTDFFDKRQGDEPINLLNLACGHCEEAAVISAFFGQGSAGSPVRFFGMDVRAREIDTARRRYEMTEKIFRKHGVPALKGESPEFEFLAGDATRLGGYKQIPDSFDVIFMRHQNVWHDRKIWQRIFEFSLDRLNPDGVLVITSYFDREHLIALDFFRALGADLIVSEKNESSRELDYPGKSVDRHMAVMRRKETVLF